MTPLIIVTSDQCHQLATFQCNCVYLSNRWQHAMEPDTGRESQFLPTTPALDAPVTPWGLVWKKLEWWVHQTVKEVFSHFDRIHKRDRQIARSALGKYHDSRQMSGRLLLDRRVWSTFGQSSNVISWASSVSRYKLVYDRWCWKTYSKCKNIFFIIWLTMRLSTTMKRQHKKWEENYLMTPINIVICKWDNNQWQLLFA